MKGIDVCQYDMPTLCVFPFPIIPLVDLGSGDPRNILGVIVA